MNPSFFPLFALLVLLISPHLSGQEDSFKSSLTTISTEQPTNQNDESGSKEPETNAADKAAAKEEKPPAIGT